MDDNHYVSLLNKIAEFAVEIILDYKIVHRRERVHKDIL